MKKENGLRLLELHVTLLTVSLTAICYRFVFFKDVLAITPDKSMEL